MENLFTDPFNILLIAAFIGFFMAFGIGANDVANSMGTSVGARALTIKQAILIAAVFEFLGAFLAGGEVTSTIRKGIVDPNLYTDQVNIFVRNYKYFKPKYGFLMIKSHSISGKESEVYSETKKMLNQNFNVVKVTNISKWAKGHNAYYIE